MFSILRAFHEVRVGMLSMSVTPIFGKGVYPTVGGPNGLGSHEDWDEISKEADYINTPDGNFIPPGCTNGHIYRV
jgi:hypothetical protein